MSSADQLLLYYEGLSDEGIKEALWLGADAYEPSAWVVLTGVALSRGIAHHEPPDTVRDDDDAISAEAERTKPWLTRLRGNPPWIRQRVALGICSVPLLLLFLDDLRGGTWFGPAAQRWTKPAAVFLLLLYAWLGPSPVAMRRWLVEKRRGIQSGRRNEMP